jgi:hypothetical protein
VEHTLPQVAPEDAGFVDLKTLVIEGDGPSNSFVDNDRDKNLNSYRSRFDESVSPKTDVNLNSFKPKICKVPQGLRFYPKFRIKGMVKRRTLHVHTCTYMNKLNPRGATLHT